MFDVGPPPKLWLPTKPSIIRAAEPIKKSPSLANFTYVNAWLLAAAASKYYFTVAFGTVPNDNGAGIALSTADLAGTLGTANSWGMLVSSTWNIVANGFGTFVDTGVTANNNDIINVAWDAGNLYLGINGTYYNSSGSSTGSSPTTPTFTGITGPVFPFGTVATTSSNMTLNPSPTPPAGFAAWGGTWNPSDKHANVTLTGSNLIANRSSNGDGRSVRGTVSYS